MNARDPSADFSQAKIYKILDSVNKYYYYGSTCQDLQKRFTEHRITSISSPNRKVYKYLNSIEWLDVSINLVEECPEVTSWKELTMIEDSYIKKCLQDPLCLNAKRAFLSKQERAEQHKLCNYKYHVSHKDERLARQRQLYHLNHDKNVQKYKQYYEMNKEDIKNKAKLRYVNKYKDERAYAKNKEHLLEKITCECGDTVSRTYMREHVKSIKHKTKIQKPPTLEELIYGHIDR